MYDGTYSLGTCMSILFFDFWLYGFLAWYFNKVCTICTTDKLKHFAVCTALSVSYCVLSLQHLLFTAGYRSIVMHKLICYTDIICNSSASKPTTLHASVRLVHAL
jgi:hypothetical protein